MSDEPRLIRVLIVHEFELMCNIISQVIDSEPDIDVIGFATSLEQAIETALHSSVDVVLISPRLPNHGSVKLTRLLVKKKPAIHILILGITETREQILEYIEAGASGYIIRESTIDELLTVIRAAQVGKAVVSPEIASALIQRVKTLAQSYFDAGVLPPDLSDLTAREMEVLQLLSQNLSNNDIAQTLVIGQGTVKNHVHNILDKLGVANREQAAELYGFYKKNSADQDSQ